MEERRTANMEPPAGSAVGHGVRRISSAVLLLALLDEPFSRAQEHQEDGPVHPVAIGLLSAIGDHSIPHSCRTQLLLRTDTKHIPVRRHRLSRQTHQARQKSRALVGDRGCTGHRQQQCAACRRLTSCPSQERSQRRRQCLGSANSSRSPGKRQETPGIIVHHAPGLRRAAEEKQRTLRVGLDRNSRTG